MSTRELIRANSRYYTLLRQSVDALCDLPSALRRQQRYIAYLEKRTETSRDRISALVVEKERELEALKRHRDSRAKKLAYRWIGRESILEIKMVQEESAYLDAWNQENQEREKYDMLEKLLEDARIEDRKLLSKQTQSKTSRSRLEKLYHDVFDGPTPDFPEDDRLELAYEVALHRVDKIKTNLKRSKGDLKIKLQSGSIIFQDTHDTLGLQASRAQVAELKVKLEKATAHSLVCKKALENFRRRVFEEFAAAQPAQDVPPLNVDQFPSQVLLDGQGLDLPPRYSPPLPPLPVTSNLAQSAEPGESAVASMQRFSNEPIVLSWTNPWA